MRWSRKEKPSVKERATQLIMKGKIEPLRTLLREKGYHGLDWEIEDNLRYKLRELPPQERIEAIERMWSVSDALQNTLPVINEVYLQTRSTDAAKPALRTALGLDGTRPNVRAARSLARVRKYLGGKSHFSGDTLDSLLFGASTKYAIVDGLDETMPRSDRKRLYRSLDILSEATSAFDYARRHVSENLPLPRSRARKYALGAAALLALNIGLPSWLPEKLGLGRPSHPLRVPVIDYPVGIALQALDTLGLFSRERGEWERYASLVSAVEGLEENGFQIRSGEAHAQRLERKVRQMAALYTGWNPVVSMDLPFGETLRESNEFAIAAGGKTLDRRRRTMIPSESLPPELAETLVFQEDRPFWSPLSTGIDYWAIAQGLLEGRGGSTIPMQTARQITYGTHGLDLNGGFFSTLTRKTQEAAGALRLGTCFPGWCDGWKEDVLTFYADHAYFGRGQHGWRAAARDTFGSETMTYGRAAVLASMLNNPSRSEDGHRAHALNLLGKMHETGALSDAAYGDATRQLPSFRNRSDSPGITQFESAISTAAKELEESGFQLLSLRRDRQFGTHIELTLDVDETNALYRAARATLASTEFKCDGCKPEFAGVTLREDGSIAAALAGASFDGIGDLNYLYTRHDIGSTGKWWLLLDLAQRIEAGADPRDFGLISLGRGRWPYTFGYDETTLRRRHAAFQNYDSRYARTTIADALKTSRNLTFVELFRQLGPREHASFLGEQLGLSISITDETDLTPALGNIDARLINVAGTTTALSPGGFHRPYIVESATLDGIELSKVPVQGRPVKENAIVSELLRRATPDAAQGGRCQVGVKTGTHENFAAYVTGYADCRGGWRGIAFGVFDPRRKEIDSHLSATRVVAPIVGGYLDRH